MFLRQKGRYEKVTLSQKYYRIVWLILSRYYFNEITRKLRKRKKVNVRRKEVYENRVFKAKNDKNREPLLTFLGLYNNRGACGKERGQKVCF